MFESIAILTHQQSEEVRGSRYFLAPLIERWERQGARVSVSAGPRQVAGEVAMLHVDTTVVEADYLALADRYPRTLNSAVTDISKRVVSRHLLQAGDRFEGPVIVKTDANYGGFMEGWYRFKAGTDVSPPTEYQRPWRRVEYLDSSKYPVYNNISDVPHGVWRNPRLVVEKFLPERTPEGRYRIHTYVFLGSCEASLWFEAPDPVIKFHNATARGLDEDIPDALRAARAARAFDFGRFDYSMVNGEASRAAIPGPLWDAFAAALHEMS